MRNLRLLAGLFMILLAGCTGKKPQWNSDIDLRVKSPIRPLDEELITALVNSDSLKVASLFSSESKKQAGKSIDSMVAAIRAVIIHKEFSILDECYIPNASSLPKPHAVTKDSVYKVFIDPTSGEVYLSLLLMKCESSHLLITCVYGREGKEWKLNSLNAGTYAYDKKNAVDFYKQAQADYRDSNLINAINNLGMARATSRPAGQQFMYVQEEQMKSFSRKVMAEVNDRYPMPMKISTIRTHPEILSVRPFPLENGIFPSVSYLSTINLQDSVKLRKENQELQREIPRLFPGIEKTNDFIFLQAYNALPAGGTGADHHEFVMQGRRNNDATSEAGK